MIASAARARKDGRRASGGRRSEGTLIGQPEASQSRQSVIRIFRASKRVRGRGFEPSRHDDADAAKV